MDFIERNDVMKIIRKLFITMVVIVGIGYGLYYFGTNFLAEKAVDEMNSKLESSQHLENMKQFIASSPELQQFIDEGATITQENLPFHTKEEAVRELMTKFNLSEMKEMQEIITDGITVEDQKELLDKVENKLSTDELNALKVLLYNEMNNN